MSSSSAAAAAVAAASGRPAVVIDNGTGYTKLGFAGNLEPSFVLPTAITTTNNNQPSTPTSGGRSGSPSSSIGSHGGGSHGALDDLGFAIGDEALLSGTGTGQVGYPVRHGIVENWDWMERYWQQCVFKYLRYLNTHCCQYRSIQSQFSTIP
eukprot:jgi/Chlat1/8752/Chrsp9S08563